MGSLLSSYNDVPPPPRFAENAYSYRPSKYEDNYRRPPQPKISSISRNTPASTRYTPRAAAQVSRPRIVHSTFENQFYNLVLNQCIQEYKWITPSNEMQVRFVPLSVDSTDYNTIKSLFCKFLKRENPVVSRIEKVQNCTLVGQYLLKKEEYRYKSISFKERLLFHGTKQKNIIDICQDNFDWRVTKRNRFGNGVSFTPKSSYAINYCDKTNVKVMFVAKVLFGRSCVGSANIALPHKGCDSTQKEDGNVIAKFYDDEFYPEYLIHFSANIIRYNNANQPKKIIH